MPANNRDVKQVQNLVVTLRIVATVLGCSDEKSTKALGISPAAQNRGISESVNGHKLNISSLRSCFALEKMVNG